MSDKLYNAYYSAKSDAAYGHCVYKNTKGEIIIVSAICAVDGPQTFMWEDAVLVGQVQLNGLVRGYGYYGKNKPIKEFYAK